MEKKYELTNETIESFGKKLYRIKALKDFSNVQKDDLGGFIESEINLSQSGDCWVYYKAKVFDKASVVDNAIVTDIALVRGTALVSGNAIIKNAAYISDDACVTDNVVVEGGSVVKGNCHLMGDARISNDEDYIVFKNWWSSGRFFTWTRSNDMWKVGCFYGTGKQLIRKAYKDSKKSGDEYKRIVNYVKSIKTIYNKSTIN